MKKAFTLIWLFVSVCHGFLEGDRVNRLEPNRIHINLLQWLAGKKYTTPNSIFFSKVEIIQHGDHFVHYIRQRKPDKQKRFFPFIDYLFRHEQCSKSGRCCSCDYLRAAERLSSCLPLLTRWHCVCWPLHTPSVPSRLTAKQRGHTDGGGEGSGFLG